MTKDDVVCRMQIRDDGVKSDCKDEEVEHFTIQCTEAKDGVDGIDCTFSGKVVKEAVNQAYKNPTDIFKVDWKKDSVLK